MTTDTAAAADKARPAITRDRGRTAGNYTILIGLAAMLVWSWGPANMSHAPDLFRYSGNMAEYLDAYKHPDFSQVGYYVEEIVVTIQMALWGTILAVVVAVPFGILAAHNMVPWYILHPARRIMDVLRAVHEVVWALLFVPAVGLGPFAGVMALFVHTTGILGKLFSEAVEAIDSRPVEGIRATGATKLQEVIYGVIPQVLPLWMSFSLYRFESNVRAATVLGVVGAGGIGQVLFELVRGFYYAQSAALLIVLVITVIITDVVSQQLRRFVL